MTVARSCCLALLALPTMLHADDDTGDALNQTMVREQIGVIPTIFGDLRRPGAWTEPALALPDGWGDMAIAVQGESIPWDAMTAPVATHAATPLSPGQRALVEFRRETELTWRQNLDIEWLTIEVHVRAAEDSRTHAEHLGDIETDVVVPCWSDRYQAIALVVGSQTPMASSSDRDWILGHGTLRQSSITGLAELRGSFGIGMAVLHIRAGAEDTPHGVNSVVDASGTETTILDSYQSGHAEAGLTYRFATWVRVGAEAAVTYRHWRHRESDPTFVSTHMLTAPLVGTIEITPVPGWSLMGWAGADTANHAVMDGRQRAVFGGSLRWIY